MNCLLLNFILKRSNSEPPELRNESEPHIFIFLFGAFFEQKKSQIREALHIKAANTEFWEQKTNSD